MTEPQHPCLPPGDPQALGATPVEGATLFALWAPEAQAVWLCLFDASGQQELARLALAPGEHGVWHGRAEGVGPGQVYGWRVAGPWAPEQGLRFNPQRLLLDPYALAVVGHCGSDLSAHLGHDPADPSQPHRHDNGPQALKARVLPHLPVAPRLHPPIKPTERVMLELHVKNASMRHPEVPEALRGSYAALAHPALIAHYRRLGVTTLELLPVQARVDEARLQALGLVNHWGYNPIGFMAVEPRYWSGRPGTTPEDELREAIAALHQAGLEVVLDVVFNHSGESDAHGPTLSLRGSANRQAYRLEPGQPAHYTNWSGCGNVLNLAEPMVLRLVMDALRHWVLAYGVDGFRFDLATCLARDAAGVFQPGGAFFAAMQADPVLRRVLWVAEPWDLGPDGYQPGAFPPGWLEWNDKARDAFRAYWLRPGDGRASRAELATRLAGSSDRFRHSAGRLRSPLASVNFITAHDGFTLRDLVSYDHRHNQANGEDNRDGHHDNLSWNAGVEGPSADPQVQATRAALQRALLATLLLARGTPLLLMGDEIGHSQQGNNNAYCQDTALSWLNWPEADAALLAFTCRALALRRADPALRKLRWLDGRVGADGLADVSWRSADGQPLDAAAWHDCQQRALQVQLAPPAGHSQTLLLFNPSREALDFALPPPQRGPAWWAWLDSQHPEGQPPKPPHPGGLCRLAPRSVQVWRSLPPP